MSVIVVVLAAYALSLCVKLFRLKRRVSEQSEAQKKVADKKNIETQESIDILLRCLLQDQLSLTEAAIRVSGLAKSLKLSEIEQQFYIPFDELAMATSHIPILADWGRLSSKEQKRFNSERETIEGEYKDKILSSARQLNKPQ
ncbi:MAG: DUF2489 domain-containing protein [Pseudomonadales bacterium]|nr:DUF2489 domain-containing protein [Pseudomonadales bacterium]